MSETIHASCVAIGGVGVLIAGPSGSGKSDLALRLIDRGATLISDDYSAVSARDGALVARPPTTIAGRIEVRGVGICTLPFAAQAEVALLVRLSDTVERMPERATHGIAGIAIRQIVLDAREPSAPIKVELALRQALNEQA